MLTVVNFLSDIPQDRALQQELQLLFVDIYRDSSLLDSRQGERIQAIKHATRAGGFALYLSDSSVGSSTELNKAIVSPGMCARR